MAKPKQAFVVEKTELPVCGGCSQCGDLDDRHLYILGHDKKYYCKVCFHKIARNWPRVAMSISIPIDRVKHWLDEVARFESQCRKIGKNRTAMYPHIPVEHRDLNQAVECAAVEVLGGIPNLDVHVGNDGKKDGSCHLGTYDIKGTVVRSNWDGPQGFNGYPPSGKVFADLIVCVLCTVAIDRAEIIGYNYRDSGMVRINGFKMPAYPRTSLLPAKDLIRRSNGQDRVQAVHGDDQVRDGDDRGLCASND